MRYPKVLIIGETFRSNGGGGITMTNLFKDWPGDKLAVITDRINETSPNANCLRYYQLGRNEYKIKFSLCHYKNSGEVDIRLITNSSGLNRNLGLKKSFRSAAKKIINKIFILTGVYYFINRIYISDQLLDWINEFSPEVIYAQPFRFFDMRFAFDLKKRISIPLAIHIMDDSISFLNKPNLLFLYWQKKTKSVFQQLVNDAEICLSISQKMSDEYKKRYKKIFIPFRNPIELDKWQPFLKNNWDIHNTVNIIYTGRLAVPNINTLYRFCEVVDDLNKKGLNIKFDIYSIDKNERFLNKIKDLNGIFIHNPVPYNDIPKLISQYDITVLPIDFNKTGIKYAKYSISTKTSEYMISRVPILLIAPEEIALTSYANENNCMLCIVEEKYEEISNGLINLINTKCLRESLAENAFATAKKDSDAYYVRQAFKEVINQKFKFES